MEEQNGHQIAIPDCLRFPYAGFTPHLHSIPPRVIYSAEEVSGFLVLLHWRMHRLIFANLGGVEWALKPSYC